MKIRIKGNSIRYRLTRTEVERFSKDGYLEEHTELPGNTFTYALKADFDAKDLDARMSQNKIELIFPDSEKTKWFESEKVGYQNILKLENGGNLKLLLEKDFVCLDEVEEDQSDNYPNPNAN